LPLKSFLDYLKLEKHHSEHTRIAYEADIQAFFSFAQAEFEISTPENVTYTVIRSWIVALSEAKISNRSINRKIASLKTYYKFLQKTGDVITSPLARHRSIKAKPQVQIPYSQQEINAVLDPLSEATDFASLRDRLLVELFYSTGMRRSELINLKISDINHGERVLKVLGKRNKERFIPVIESLEEILSSYLEKRENSFSNCEVPYLLLTNKGVKMYNTLVYRIINHYFSAVSQKVKTSPHILRHTFATHLLNNGADLNSVKELLGHSSLASTQVYTHNSIVQLQKVHERSHPRNKNKKESMQ
jgi:integrase/recombinase XerC